jgi:hypothetical protein
MLKNLLMKLSIAGELLSFLWAMKLWWMIPMVLMLLLLGGIIIFAQSSAIAPERFVLPSLRPLGDAQQGSVYCAAKVRGET